MSSSFPYAAAQIPERSLALTFADYLNQRGIAARAEPGLGEAYTIYVAREDDVIKVRIELMRFAENPLNKAYSQAAWQRHGSAGIPASGSGRTVRSRLPAVLFADKLSVTTWTEIICVLVYVCSLLLPGVYDRLLHAFSLYRMTDLTEHYELWRLITPVFFHFGIMHISFNLVMWEAFARPMERYLGKIKLLGICVIMAMISNGLEFLWLDGRALFGGMSGVVYGLIAYCGVLSLRKDIPTGLHLPRGLFTVSLVFIALGFFMSGIANLCHLGGFATGALLGFADVFKKSLRR